MTGKAAHLLEEPPIICYPHLAKMIGINQALILQQLHFLLNGVKTEERQFNHVDDQWWVYNSYANWQRKYFVWLSADRIKRIFIAMEKDGYIVSRQGVKNSFDREKWYRIDYEKWEQFKAAYDKKHPEASAYTAPSIGLKQHDGEGQVNLLNNGLKQHDDLYKNTKTPKKSKSESLDPAIANALDAIEKNKWTLDDNDTVLRMQADGLIQAFERAHRESGAPSSVPRGKNVYKAAIQFWKDGYRSDEIYATVQKLIEEHKPIAFVFLGEALAAHRIKATPIGTSNVRRIGENTVPREWGVNDGIVEAAHE